MESRAMSETHHRLSRRTLTAALVALAGTGPAWAQAGPAKDHIGLPGPIRFGDADYFLAWSARPNPTYVKQEYLPAGQRLERYAAMLIVETLTSGVTVAAAAGSQINTLDRRKANDPVVNYQVLRNEARGEIILDFVMSAGQGDATIIEWNAYRYTPRRDGVNLFAISRRGYGGGAREFLVGLRTWRMATITTLADYRLPELRPEG